MSSRRRRRVSREGNGFLLRMLRPEFADRRQRLLLALVGSLDFVGLALLSLPWIVTGLLFTLLSIAAIISRFCCFRRPVRKARRFWRDAQGLVRVFEVVFSLLVTLSTFIAAAVGLIAAFTARQTASQVLRVLSASGSTVEAVVGLVASSVRSVADILANGAEFVTEDLIDEYTALSNSVNAQVASVEAIRDEVTAYVSDARNINDTGSTISAAVFIGLAVILVVISLAPILGKFVESRRSSAQICFLLLLTIPMLLSWVLTGIVASVGSGLGDSCPVVADFQLSVLESAGLFSPTQPIESNDLIDSGIRCPRELIDVDLSVIETLLGQIAETESVIVALALLLEEQEVSEDFPISLIPLIEVSQNIVQQLQACKFTTDLAGRLDQYLCGDYIGSAVSAVRSLFASLISLALLSTIIFIMSLSGLSISSYADIWYNAFGDAESDGQYTDFDPDEQNESLKDASDGVYTGKYNIQGSVPAS